MKKLKIFKTNKQKKLILIDLSMILACIIYMRLIFKKSFIKMVIAIPINIYNAIILSNGIPSLVENISSIIVSILLVDVIMVLIFSFPLNIICFAYRRSYKRKIKETNTFESIQDIEYFRDTFNNISPAIISNVIDFEIEYKKDITATIMKLIVNKNIKFDNDKIVLISSNTENLKESEIFVLDQIKNNKLIKDNNTIIENEEFAKLGIKEAEEDGYIIRKNSIKHFITKSVILIILFIGTMNLFNSQVINYDTIDNFDREKLSQNVTEEEALEVLTSDEMKNILAEMKKFFIKVITGIIMIFIPIYGLIYIKMYNIAKPKYKRTNKGNILIEQLYGLKNYIHDFSYLNEATKEQIVLWEDFLIYAILLEENEKIIEEICKLKKVTIPKI